MMKLGVQNTPTHEVGTSPGTMAEPPPPLLPLLHPPIGKIMNIRVTFDPFLIESPICRSTWSRATTCTSLSLSEAVMDTRGSLFP